MLVEDVDTFLNLEEFAVEVTFFPGQASAVVIKAVVDYGPAFEAQTYRDATAEELFIACAEAQTPVLEVGDEMEYAGKRFKYVRRVDGDGGGFHQLLFERDVRPRMSPS